MNARLIIPIVAALLALLMWLLNRDSYDGHKNQYIWPAGTFVVAFILGNIGVGVVQGMKEAAKQKGKKK